MPGSINNPDSNIVQRVRTPFRVAFFTAISLAAIDVLINLLFAYPSDPKVTNPSSLRLYFEYGRSAEGQLRRMTRPDRSQTAQITLPGWYNPPESACWNCPDASGVKPASNSQNSVVTFYGMSHTLRLGYALGRVSDRFTTRIFSAPGATSNWSYGVFLRDRGGGKSHAVVLGFSSRTIPWITSMSPMTFVYDHPIPYTADRFYLEGGRLRAIHPPYTSFEQYVETLYDPSKWSSALDFFAKNDETYSPFMMRASVLDHSSLFRLVRRAAGQQISVNRAAAVLDKTGFKPDSEQIRLAEGIIHEFAIIARQDGMVPIVYLVNDLGYSDFLYQALGPVLRADNIPYLSSHTIVPPNDPRGYLPDTHFTEKFDDKLATALVDIIDRQDAHLSQRAKL